MDVPLTMMARPKMSTTTKMAAMTKKLPGTYQGVYRARMGTVVGSVFGWLSLQLIR